MLFEVIGRQSGQELGTDVILAKCRVVAFQTQVSQPIYDIHRRFSGSVTLGADEVVTHHAGDEDTSFATCQYFGWHVLNASGDRHPLAVEKGSKHANRASMHGDIQSTFVLLLVACRPPISAQPLRGSHH
jgi:hypothetical protein